jgi:hypothetical protein
MTRLHLVLYAATALMLGLTVAACGATGQPSGTTTNASSSSSSAFALAQCMRSHGVPNFPDPTKGPGGGTGFSINTSPGSSTLTVDGTTFEGPVFESAVKRCKLFGGGTAPPPITASQKRAAVLFAECMRKNGVPNFPDPTFPAGGGIAQGSGTNINRASPAFQRAVAICNRRSS